MQDLRNWLQGLPVSARPASNWYLLRKFVLRHRIQTAIVCLLAVIIPSTGFIGVFSLGQVSAAKEELDAARQAYSTQKAQDMALISQTAFGIFLEFWHDDDTRAKFVREYLPEKNSPAYRAASFLLDPRSLTEKINAPQSDVNTEDAFWQFILAEQHNKDGNLEEARRAYRQCIQNAQDDEVWWVSVARARQEELR